MVWARRLASLWLTLALIVAVAAVLIYTRLLDRPVGWTVAAPFLGLGLNLAAALAVNTRLQRQTGLLVFHVGLALLAVSAGMGRLMSFDGRVEVTEGMPLDPALIDGGGGPLHHWRLRAGAFEQGPIRIAFHPGMLRAFTESTVAVRGPAGWREQVVGDDRPLLLDGYRLYTSKNKGYALLIEWRPDGGGQASLHAVNLPPFPAHLHDQANRWTPPGTNLSLMLHLDTPTPVATPESGWEMTLPADARLAVVTTDERRALRRGEATRLPGGHLRFVELRRWMGYSVFHDPSLPWLAAAVIVAAIGLAWHAFGKVRGVAALADLKEPM